MAWGERLAPGAAARSWPTPAQHRVAHYETRTGTRHRAAWHRNNPDPPCLTALPDPFIPAIHRLGR